MYHSEVMSMHGFHFELKAVGGRDGIYSFYLQVKHSPFTALSLLCSSCTYFIQSLDSR